MRKTARLLLPLALICMAGCASLDGPAANGIPPGAVEATRTEPNGDVVTEYRIAGQLRAVKVVPSRGPTYYLYDNDGDGLVDKPGDNPPRTYFKLFEW